MLAIDQIHRLLHYAGLKNLDNSRVRDRNGSQSVNVRYSGIVPDPFRDGREVIVDGKLQDGTFVAERDSLVTKCPSKFQNANSSSDKSS